MTVAEFLALHPGASFDLLAEFGYISRMGLDRFDIAQNDRGVITTDNGAAVPMQTVLDQNVLGVDQQAGGTLLYTGQYAREEMYEEENPPIVQAM